MAKTKTKNFQQQKILITIRPEFHIWPSQSPSQSYCCYLFLFIFFTWKHDYAKLTVYFIIVIVVIIKVQWHFTNVLRKVNNFQYSIRFLLKNKMLKSKTAQHCQRKKPEQSLTLHWWPQGRLLVWNQPGHQIECQNVALWSLHLRGMKNI